MSLLPRSIDALRSRVRYSGFDYRTQREVTKTGSEWRADAEQHNLIVQRNEDSLAAFSTPTKSQRREMQFEIYERAGDVTERRAQRDLGLEVRP